MQRTKPGPDGASPLISGCSTDATVAEWNGRLTVPDYPHHGPNISRIRLEGAGGFIYALTPVLILLLGAPLLLAAAVAAGAAIAPLIYWRHHSHPRAWTQTLGTISAFLLGLLLTLQVGSHRTFRVLAVACVVGGILASALIAWRSGRVRHPSIRDHRAG
jgi:hypothetical protein